MKHTPGPYFYNPRTGKVWADTNRLSQYDGNDVVVCQITTRNLLPSEPDSNGMRIAQCLNACNGMENPVEQIEFMKERIKNLTRMIEEHIERSEAIMGGGKP